MEIEEHEAITEKDEQLIKLMICQPSLTSSQIAKLLGVSKQAVSSRRKKLEDEGVIQNYVFWNIASKQELTKAFEIDVRGALNSQVEELINYLVQNWKVALVWLSSHENVCGMILTDKEKTFIKVVKNEFPFIKDIKIQPIRFRKFLGQEIKLKAKDEKDLEMTLCDQVKELSKIKSVDAILYLTEPERATVNLVVLRNKRFHKHETAIYSDKIFNDIKVHISYATYEILKEMAKKRRKRDWIRKLKIAFARDRWNEKRLKYLLRVTRHI